MKLEEFNISDEARLARMNETLDRMFKLLEIIETKTCG